MRKNHNAKLSLLMTTAKECIGQHLVCDDIDKLILGLEAIFSNKPLLNQIIELCDAGHGTEFSGESPP